MSEEQLKRVVEVLIRDSSAAKRERDEALGRVKVLERALHNITSLIAVKTNTGLIHLEIGGSVAYRPIERANIDALGTLFTHLFNAESLIGPEAK